MAAAWIRRPATGALACQAWEQVPEARIREDIGRFPTALHTIIAAKGSYVPDMDLRHGHRAPMQRLVRGGGEEENATANAIKEKIKKGLLAAMASWEGLTADLEARGGPSQKYFFLECPIFKFFYMNSYVFSL